MHKTAFVFFNKILAGTLSKLPKGYEFKYENSYLENAELPQIAWTLPKQKEPFFSETLFPFFAGLLSEGANREIQEKLLKTDDNFTLLIKTAHTETIGAVTVRENL